MSDVNGTGMSAPANNEPAGAVTSREATRKKPQQGKFRSGIQVRGFAIDRYCSVLI